MVTCSKKRTPVPTMPVDNSVQVEHLSSLVTAHFKDMSEHVWLGGPEEVYKEKALAVPENLVCCHSGCLEH